MKKLPLLLLLAIKSTFLFSQITLTIEGTIVKNTETGTWLGVKIPNNQITTFIYRNNSITSVNASGYMLQAGDELPGSNNNKLDGEIITGNKFIWNGTDTTSLTHGIFTGYNINAVLKYNYLNKTPMALIRKSNGMTNTSGGVAYNIVVSPKVAFVAKGINNVRVYNNTFYSAKTASETWRGLVDIYSNTDDGLNTPSAGTKIFNNIFYTKHQILNIYVYDDACLSGLESDYNIFWCEDGEPLFKIRDTVKTFLQWQALGYDTHSVIMNPDFMDFIDFVPYMRLDYGTDLGTTWQAGLSVDAKWSTSDPDTTNQNGPWQVGARIYNANNSNNLGEKKKERVIIYPNPASDFFFISIKDSTLSPQILKIFDMSGNIDFTRTIEQRITNVKVPGNLKTGIYFVSLVSDGLVLYTQKLMIINNR
jgi:hypothetical protein